MLSIPYFLALEAQQRKKAHAHSMPLRALEDVLHARVSDRAIAAELQQQVNEEKESSLSVHKERV